jgi:hypothetical protein
MESEVEVLTTDDLVSMGKVACYVETPTDEMSDDEIRRVVRWIATSLVKVEGDILLDRAAVELMLFIAVSEFPEFFTRYGLAQYN